MRADRLMSMVMLLQTHGKMTAPELATKLEVSERTIYRDVTALNTAGIPIYTDRGPGGGIALLESYRTTLTGMSEDEAQALFMMSIPQALVELGVGNQLKSALLKLAAAMPPGQRSIPARAQQRILLDSTPWQSVDATLPHLAVLQESVWQDRCVRLVFRGSFDAPIEVEIEPYGLVAKMNTWYLIGSANSHFRVLKVRDILEVDLLNTHFTRDGKFDLGDFWSQWCIDSVNRRPSYVARLRMSPGLIAKLGSYLEETIEYQVNEALTNDHNGWKEVNITYDNFFLARESILNFGRAAEVIEPEALRLSVIDFARQIVELYKPK